MSTTIINAGDRGGEGDPLQLLTLGTLHVSADGERRPRRGRAGPSMNGQPIEASDSKRVERASDAHRVAPQRTGRRAAQGAARTRRTKFDPVERRGAAGRQRGDGRRPSGKSIRANGDEPEARRHGEVLGPGRHRRPAAAGRDPRTSRRTGSRVAGCPTATPMTQKIHPTRLSGVGSRSRAPTVPNARAATANAKATHADDDESSPGVDWPSPMARKTSEEAPAATTQMTHDANVTGAVIALAPAATARHGPAAWSRR